MKEVILTTLRYLLLVGTLLVTQESAPHNLTLTPPYQVEGTSQLVREDLNLLHIAVLQNDLVSTQILINNYRAVGGQDSEGNTPLHYAVQCASKEMVILLKKNGAETETKNKHNESPLDKACERKDQDITNALVTTQPDESLIQHQGNRATLVDQVTPVTGIQPKPHPSFDMSLLSIAILRGNLSLIPLLAKNYPGINDQDSEGDTPLHYAVAFGDTETVAVLLNNGARLDLENEEGYTPVDEGFERKDIAIMQLLVPPLEGAGVLKEIPGSPFNTSCQPMSVAYSPNGSFCAVANNGAPGSVSVYKVKRGGALTEIPGSPFPAGSHPLSVAYSPNGLYCAVANTNPNVESGSVSVYRVGNEGVLTEVPGSPFPAGRYSFSVTYSPDGLFCAVANMGSDNVSVYRVRDGGVLIEITGSPFPTGPSPRLVTYSPDGLFCMVAHMNNIAVYSVGDGGQLTHVPGSFSGGTPGSLAYSPDGSYCAIASTSSTSNVWVYSVGAGGALTSIPDSPFPAGSSPISIAYSPDGLYCAVTYYNSLGSVSAYTVGDKGELKLVCGAPFPAGSFPRSIAYSPNGLYLALAYSGSQNGGVSIYRVGKRN